MIIKVQSYDQKFNISALVIFLYCIIIVACTQNFLHHTESKYAKFGSAASPLTPNPSYFSRNEKGFNQLSIDCYSKNNGKPNHQIRYTSSIDESNPSSSQSEGEQEYNHEVNDENDMLFYETSHEISVDCTYINHQIDSIVKYEGGRGTPETFTRNYPSSPSSESATSEKGQSNKSTRKIKENRHEFESSFLKESIQDSKLTKKKRRWSNDAIFNLEISTIQTNVRGTKLKVSSNQKLVGHLGNKTVTYGSALNGHSNQQTMRINFENTRHQALLNGKDCLIKNSLSPTVTVPSSILHSPVNQQLIDVKSVTGKEITLDVVSRSSENVPLLKTQKRRIRKRTMYNGCAKIAFCTCILALVFGLVALLKMVFWNSSNHVVASGLERLHPHVAVNTVSMTSITTRDSFVHIRTSLNHRVPSFTSPSTTNPEDLD